MLLRWHVHVGLDIQERTQFHDCTVGVAGNVYYDRDYNNAEQKVGYFSPLTLVGLRVPTVAPTTGVSVTVLLEQTYYFTFRNPKFGGDPAATASLSTKTIDAPVAVQSLLQLQWMMMADLMMKMLLSLLLCVVPLAVLLLCTVEVMLASFLSPVIVNFSKKCV